MKDFLMFVSLPQDAQSYADDNSLLFMETSAKTSMNVNEIFMAIGKFPQLNLYEGFHNSEVNQSRMIELLSYC